MDFPSALMWNGPSSSASPKAIDEHPGPGEITQDLKTHFTVYYITNIS